MMRVFAGEWREDGDKKFIHWFFFIIHSLKIECEKLSQEKTEMQRHYVMVSLNGLLVWLKNEFEFTLQVYCTYVEFA